MPRKPLTALVFTLALSASTVLAHEHKVLGTVTSTTADQVMMKTTDGKAVTVKLTPDTKVTKAKAPVKITTVKEGTRIVVTTESDEAPYTATLIEIGKTPESSPKEK
jgi:hypothetical protein